MATIYHQVGIKAPVEKVFNAIATLEGVSGWWTLTTGTPTIDGQLTFSFGEHDVIAKVTAYKSNKHIEWKVQGEEGEWLNTRICFDLDEKPDQVMVNFQHADWKEATNFLAHCSTKWAVFLLSLKKYVETGTGMSFPDDIHINHSNL
jgi:uncharacterized protein YndB with AHSA1/START domain